MPNILDILEQHAVFLNDRNENAIYDLALQLTLPMGEGPTIDVADLALRTCRCGREITGFDDYHHHLREEIERTIE